MNEFKSCLIAGDDPVDNPTDLAVTYPIVELFD